MTTPEPTVDLMAALRASLDRAKRKRADHGRCSDELAAALADVCGYHEGDACPHCAEVVQHRRGLGWTDAQILADIDLYRADFDAWAAKVRARAASRHAPTEAS